MLANSTLLLKVDLLRNVLKNCERREGKSYYMSEPISSQSSAMLVHTLERCLEDGERSRGTQANRIAEVSSDNLCAMSNDPLYHNKCQHIMQLLTQSVVQK